MKFDQSEAAMQGYVEQPGVRVDARMYRRVPWGE